VSPDAPANVIVLAIDTLRNDHLGCYGYPRPTSPNIDAFARQGVVADRFFAAGIPTHPSFTTFYTGQHPITHGIVAHGPKNSLAKESPFLTQSLLAAGYTTCAVDCLAQARPWFKRGYEFYIDPSLRHVLFLDVSCEELNARAIPWMKCHADESFFLFIHYWDPHWPLSPPPKYQHLFYDGNPVDPNNHTLDRWWDHPLGWVARESWMRRPEGIATDPKYGEALYDQEIRHLDDGIGEFLGALDQLGLASDSLVLLYGDHGESLTEHGIFFDHHGLYDPVLHVPLIARWPGKIPAGTRLPQLLQHQDLAPTILEAAGEEVPAEMDGESAWQLMRGESTAAGRDRIFSCECTWQAKWSMRTERYKFIKARKPDLYDSPERELYDLSADPGELHNQVDAQPTLAAKLEQELEEWVAERLQEQGKEQDPLLEQEVSLTVG
jgi:arylsulfatase